MVGIGLPVFRSKAHTFKSDRIHYMQALNLSSSRFWLWGSSRQLIFSLRMQKSQYYCSKIQTAKTMESQEPEKTIFKEISSKINTGSIYDYFIIGVISIGVNHFNQSFSWNFEHFSGAVISFSISTLLWIYLLVLSVRWAIKAKVLTSRILPVLVAMLLLTFLLFSAFSFSNYATFRNATHNKQNHVYIYESSTLKGQEHDAGRRWAILNNLASSKADGETLVFAQNLSKELRREIEQRKLPIALIEEDEVPTTLLDSLAGKYHGLYIIKGTYANREANIEVENVFKEDKAQLLFSRLAAGLNLDIDSLAFPQLFQLPEPQSKVLVLPSSSESKVLDNYKLKLGIPNEIKYFVLSTIGDFIVRDLSSVIIGYEGLVDSAIIEKVEHGLSVLSFAEQSTPHEINYFGFRPKIRADLNVSNLYWNMAYLHDLKARILLAQTRVSNDIKPDFSTSIGSLEQSKRYLEKLPRKLKPSMDSTLFLENYRNHLAFYQSELTWGSLRLKEMQWKSHLLSTELSRYAIAATNPPNLSANSGQSFQQPNTADAPAIQAPSFPRSDRLVPSRKVVDRWQEINQQLLQECKDFISVNERANARMERYQNKAQKSHQKQIAPFVLTTQFALNTNRGNLATARILVEQLKLSQELFEEMRRKVK